MKPKTLNSHLVLIKVNEAETKDESGIFIQEEWQSLPPTGVVLQVADDVTFCKKGDNVFFERYSAVKTPFGDDTRLCREDGIFAVYAGK